MKLLLLFPFWAFTSMVLAQTFTEYPTPSPFEGLFDSSIAFSDVNGDGAPDLLVAGGTGTDFSGVYCEIPSMTKLYLNDGNGNFTEMQNTPFAAVTKASLAFADVNGDGTSDVLITGQDSSGTRIAKLYINDGTGIFSEMLDTPFEGVASSSIAFADVNGDGSPDVLITGQNNSDDANAKLYVNDAMGGFNEMPDTPFEGVGFGSIAFSDVNGDGTSDLLITGRNNSNDVIAKLYTNNGMGSFTEMPGTPFAGVWESSIAFSDVDGNGSADVLISGYADSGPIVTKLFINNGTGSFTEETDTPFEGVGKGSLALADMNGDGTSDVLITGHNSSEKAVTKLYINNGTGSFTEKTDTPFTGVAYSSAALSDVDGNGLSDVFLIGATHLWFLIAHPIAKLFFNDGDGNFSEMLPPPFKEVAYGLITFSDVNGDGASDVFITGIDIDSSSVKMYINDGNGNFLEMPDIPFKEMYISSIALSDVNGDGSPDVLITGYDSTDTLTAKLYTNDGTGSFTEVMDTPFEGVDKGSVAFADVNGDGISDVLITGQDSSPGFSLTVNLYLNDGTGSFSEMPDTPFTGVYKGSAAFSDVDGDNSPDVLITGQDSSYSTSVIAKLYMNDGNGNFTEQEDSPFEGVSYSSVAFSDVNGDGSPDVLIAGEDSSATPITRLYINDGMGGFSEMPNTPFEGMYVNSIAFSDVNGDGTSDVLITGSSSKLYANDGEGNFTEIPDTPFIGVSGSSVAFSDVNGDGKPDVLISGESCSTAIITKLYLNEGTVSSTPVRNTERIPRAVIYPNPNSNGQINIEYLAANNSVVQISMFDLSGKVMLQSNVNIATGSNSIPIATGALPKGMYLLKLDDSVQITILKFIVQ